MAGSGRQARPSQAATAYSAANGGGGSAQRSAAGAGSNRDAAGGGSGAAQPGATESDSEEDFDDDASGSDAEEEEEEEPAWVAWFCSLRGNEFFCEVEEEYIEDDFNLCGLSSMVPYYDYALDMILDNEPPQDVVLTEQQHELLESAAEMLYGLIHARYIITTRGLAAMVEKLRAAEFGHCPRVLCEGQACCPVGPSDVPGMSTVKVFCPRCEDMYSPRSDEQQTVDGAYFGTTFPHLLLLTYPMHRPPKADTAYVPRIFGFRLHPTAYANRPAPPPQRLNRAAITAAVATAAAQQRAGGPGRPEDESL